MNMQWYFASSDRHNITVSVSLPSFCSFWSSPSGREQRLISSAWVRYKILFISSSNSIFCSCMWTGQGGVICGSFQEMLSSWVHRWCWMVLQGELPINGCDWSYPGLISGPVWVRCLSTGSKRDFLFWCGSCRHISSMTPGDSGFIFFAKPSASALPFSAPTLPYIKAPPFQVSVHLVLWLPTKSVLLGLLNQISDMLQWIFEK